MKTRRKHYQSLKAPRVSETSLDGAVMQSAERLQPRGAGKITVIAPRSGWQPFQLASLWEFRGLFLEMVRRDIRVRYKQTILGVLWALLKPISAMVVFSFVFNKVGKMPSDAQLPYPVFLYPGILAWSFFGTVVSTGTTSVLGSSAMVSKVYFPRLMIPLTVVGAALVDLSISLLALLGLLFKYQVPLRPTLLGLPIAILSLVLVAAGCATFLAALTMKIRDTAQIVPFALQAGMFLTPIVYPLSAVPSDLRWAVELNPMTGIINCFRWSLLGLPLDIRGFAVSLVWACLICIFGIAYFQRIERQFADLA